MMTKCIFSIVILLLNLNVSGQKLKRIGSFGLVVTPINDSIAKANNLNSVTGLIVKSIVPGLTGDLLKIKVGDIVLSINGYTSIPQRGLLLNEQLMKREGDEVTYLICRNGKQMTLKGRTVARQIETSTEFNIIYDQFNFKNGRNRCIISSPKTAGKKAAILLIQGYPCNTIDNSSPNSTIKRLSDELTRRGYIVMRAEKPGVGDSEGEMECYDIDFKTEVESFKAAYIKLKTIPNVDTSNLFILGLSMGGMEAPFIASQVNPKGVIVYGVTTKSWYEYLLEMLRFQNPNMGVDFVNVETEMKLYYTLLYDLFINKKKPSNLITENPAYLPLLKRDFNYVKDDDFLTRNVVFSQSLNDCDVPKEWSKVKANVFSAFGEYDIQAINSFGHREIVDIVNKYNPGKALYKEYPKTEHGLIELLDEKEKWDIHNVPEAMQKAIARGLNAKFINDVDGWIKAVIEKNGGPLDQYQDITEPTQFAPELSIKGNTYKGCFTSDMRQFVFFRKNSNEKYEDYRIFVSNYGQGKWNEPKLINFTDTSSDVYPAISLVDPTLLYFTSYRRTPNDTSKRTNANFWFSKMKNGNWGKPEPLLIANLTYNYNAQPCITKSGTIYFSSLSDNYTKNTTYKMELTNGLYQSPVPFDFINNLRKSDPTMSYRDSFVSPDETFLILSATDVHVIDPKLYVSFKNGDTWTAPKYIGDIIKKEMNGGFPYITPNGKYLLFTRDRNGFYILPTKTFIK